MIGIWLKENLKTSTYKTDYIMLKKLISLMEM
jgi:hypothetical protein